MDAMNTPGPLPRAARWLVAGLCAGVLAVLAGCATPAGSAGADEDELLILAPGTGPAQDGGPAPTEEALAQVPRLVVEAPEALRRLLETHLDLARAIQLPDAHTLDPGEWARLAGTVPDQARALARTLGYFNPEVALSAGRVEGDLTELLALDGSAVQRVGRSYTLVRLVVQPGPKARVRELDLRIQGELAQLAEQGDDEARELQRAVQVNWALPTGAAFENDLWRDAKTAAIARLRAAGYAQASWRATSAEVEPGLNRVAITAELDSGPLFRAGPIEVEGLVREELAPIQALAGWRAGQSLTEARLVEYQERLAKTGLFDQVAVTLDTDPARAQAARVLVKVREATLHTATFAIGLTTDTGPRASVEHTYRRVFGLPVIARNKLSWTQDTQALDSEFSTHRDGKFNRDLLGVVVSRTDTGDEVLLSQRWRLGRAHDSPVREWLSFFEAERAKECDLVSGTGGFHCTQIRALSLNRHAIWRRLDSVILPTSGYAFQWQSGAGLSDTISGDENGQRGPFARLYARLIGYQPLGQVWYGQARLELGQVFKSARQTVPDSQLFRAGGDESVRGYGWRSLAPTSSDGALTGGAVMLTASAEIARPITRSMPSLWWAAFVDAGNAAERWSELDPALGYGLGLRWRSPVGPLKVDWAWGRELSKARLHISVGLAF